METISLPDSREIQCFQGELLNWFKKHNRKFPWRQVSTSCYEHIISELLLQRTRAETVASFFPKFIREFPSWQKLACASELKLQRHLQPIGLWRRRATSMRALAKEMETRLECFPNNREEIEALPGVGQYIANSSFYFAMANQNLFLIPIWHAYSNESTNQDSFLIFDMIHTYSL